MLTKQAAYNLGRLMRKQAAFPTGGVSQGAGNSSPTAMSGPWGLASSMGAGGAKAMPAFQAPRASSAVKPPNLANR